MIAIFSDTHSVSGHELEGAALRAAREADVVIHAGDFTSEAALEAFQEVCEVFFPVHGNADSAAVRERLPTARVVEAAGVRFGVTHRRDGGEMGLVMFGRSRDADIVVSGHSHRPRVVETEDVLLLNPGSHADPRGNRPGFAVLEPRSDGKVSEQNETEPEQGEVADDGRKAFEGEIREPDGTKVTSFELRVTGADAPEE